MTHHGPTTLERFAFRLVEVDRLEDADAESRAAWSALRTAADEFVREALREGHDASVLRETLEHAVLGVTSPGPLRRRLLDEIYRRLAKAR